MHKEANTMLKGFEKYNMSPGLAAITITPNGIGFSKTAVQRMNKCEYVVVLIDYSGKRFAVQKCGKSEEGATRFYRGQKTVAVRWNNKELTKTLCSMMNWDIGKNTYKVNGDYDPEEEAIVFDLSTAEVLDKK
ncbi:MAG: hypothetical protein MSS24_01710 [Clostridiales bacterium]|nr:hypothetical protein [Clostridiales bacterium]